MMPASSAGLSLVHLMTLLSVSTGVWESVGVDSAGAVELLSMLAGTTGPEGPWCYHVETRVRARMGSTWQCL